MLTPNTSKATAGAWTRREVEFLRAHTDYRERGRSRGGLFHTSEPYDRPIPYFAALFRNVPELSVPPDPVDPTWDAYAAFERLDVAYPYFRPTLPIARRTDADQRFPDYMDLEVGECSYFQEIVSEGLRVAGLFKIEWNWSEDDWSGASECEAEITTILDLVLPDDVMWTVDRGGRGWLKVLMDYAHRTPIDDLIADQLK